MGQVMSVHPTYKHQIRDHHYIKNNIDITHTAVMAKADDIWSTANLICEIKICI